MTEDINWYHGMTEDINWYHGMTEDIKKGSSLDKCLLP